jgi:hypothetical protein
MRVADLIGTRREVYSISDETTCVSPKFYPRRKWRVSPCATAGRV